MKPAFLDLFHIVVRKGVVLRFTCEIQNARESVAMIYRSAFLLSLQNVVKHPCNYRAFMPELNMYAVA